MPNSQMRCTNQQFLEDVLKAIKVIVKRHRSKSFVLVENQDLGCVNGCIYTAKYAPNQYRYQSLSIKLSSAVIGCKCLQAFTAYVLLCKTSVRYSSWALGQIWMVQTAKRAAQSQFSTPQKQMAEIQSERKECRV